MRIKCRSYHFRDFFLLFLDYTLYFVKHLTDSCSFASRWPDSLTWAAKQSWIYPAHLLLAITNDKSSKLNRLYSALTGTIRTPLACTHVHLAGPVHRWGQREGGAHLWISTMEKPMLHSDICQLWASKLKPKMPWPNLMLNQEHRPRAVWII